MRYRKLSAAEGTDDRADSVIAAFEDAFAGAGDRAGVLRLWIDRYPSLAHDLSMAAGGIDDMGTEVEEMSVGPGRDALYDSMTAALIDEVLMSQPSPAISAKEVDLPANLADASRQAGIDYPRQLASYLRVPESLLRHLQRGAIDLRTIPSTFAQDLAEALHLTFADAARILRGPTPGSGLVLEEKPSYGETQSFESILATESNPDDRAYWNDRSRFAAMLE